MSVVDFHPRAANAREALHDLRRDAGVYTPPLLVAGEAEQPRVDPTGDPIELLSKDERELVEGRPYLKKLFLSTVEEAERTAATKREEAERRVEIEGAHAENDRVRELGARVIAERAAARAK
jgi:hypothetical protein